MTLLGLDLPYLPAEQAARDQEYVATERRKAAATVRRLARDEVDENELLDMLGLNETGKTDE